MNVYIITVAEKGTTEFYFNLYPLQENMNVIMVGIRHYHLLFIRSTDIY